MSAKFKLSAAKRSDLGKGASRRLRHAGKIPAIIYGGGKDAQSLVIDHNAINHCLEAEAFYTSILTIDIDGSVEKAVLKDVQRHPYKPLIRHIDLQRINENEKIRMHIPLHFLGADLSPGVKGGGAVAHLKTEVEVICLPKDLPEFIEVDISALESNQTLHLSDIVLSDGVQIVELAHGAGHDQSVVSVQVRKVVADVDTEAPVAESESETSEDSDEGES